MSARIALPKSLGEESVVICYQTNQYLKMSEIDILTIERFDFISS